jgi:hypothetical protein
MNMEEQSNEGGNAQEQQVYTYQRCRISGEVGEGDFQVSQVADCSTILAA